MRNVRELAMCLVCAASLVGCPHDSVIAPLYTSRDVYGNGSWVSPDFMGFGSSLNNSGAVAGYSTTEYAPSVWQNGAVTKLPETGQFAPYSHASAISNSGVVVGPRIQYVPGEPENHEYDVVMWVNGQESTLYSSTTGDWQDGIPLAVEVWAVNDNLQVVGSAYGPDSAERLEPALFVHGKAVLLPTLAPDAPGAAYDINKHGDIAGYCATSSDGTVSQAVLWATDKMIPLGDLGSGSSVAYALNDRRQVVGISSPPLGVQGTEEAFVWSDGVMTRLPKGGADGSRALDINNDGYIAGDTYKTGGEDRTAVLWRPMPDGSYKLVILANRLFVPGAPAHVPTPSTAVDINDRGQILAQGYGQYDPEYILLTPVGCAF